MYPSRMDVARALRPALTRLYLLYFRKSEQSNVSQAQLSIMMILDANGPMRISQIAAMESIRMPTASNAVNQLEQMGLVDRVRDVSDRRGVRVELTKKGRAELDDIGNVRNEQLASMLSNITDAELAEIAKLVPLIGLILERYSEDSDPASDLHAPINLSPEAASDIAAKLGDTSGAGIAKELGERSSGSSTSEV